MRSWSGKETNSKKQGWNVTPAKRVTTLSNDENDENVPVPCSSKRKKQKTSKKIQLQMAAKTYNPVASVAKNGTKMRMIAGLFVIFVAKQINYNTVVYNMKLHNTGQFSLTKLSLSLMNAR